MSLIAFFKTCFLVVCIEYLHTSDYPQWELQKGKTGAFDSSADADAALGCDGHRSLPAAPHDASASLQGSEEPKTSIV